MARKPLLGTPVLNRDDVQNRLAGDDLMSRVIENDAAKHGRSASLAFSTDEVSKDLSKQVSNAASIEASTPLLTQVSTPTQSQMSKAPSGDTESTISEEVPLATRSTRSRVPTRENKERNIRLSIDVPESVYDRIKQYVHEKKVESTRALTLALYESFLEEEGY